MEALSRHPRLVAVGDGDEVLPGVTAYLAPGHTPGHLIFVVEGVDQDLLLVQDAAKYRAELVTHRADMTYDPAVTAATIERIWSFWRRKPGSIVIPATICPCGWRQASPTGSAGRKPPSPRSSARMSRTGRCSTCPAH